MLPTMRHKIEAVFFFLAMILAIVLEGGIGDWLCQGWAGQRASFGLTGQRTGAALPRAWLVGALVTLVHKLIVMFTPSLSCGEGEVRQKRKDFFRLWHWGHCPHRGAGFRLLS